MAIRTDRPAPPPPKPATPAPAGPPPLSGADAVGGTSRVDGTSDIDGVEGIDDIAQQAIGPRFASLMATGKAAALSPSSPPANTAAPTTAKTSEPGVVTWMVEAALGKIAPGDSIAIGTKAEVEVELGVEGEVELEVTKRDDGRFDVKIGGDGAAGIGVALGAKINAGLSGEIEFVVDTLDQAALVTSRIIAMASAGTPIAPGAGTVAGAAAAVLVSDAQLKEVRYGAGVSAKGEVEAKIDSSLKAKLGIAGDAKIFYGIASPDQMFAELELEAEGSAMAHLGPTTTGGELTGTYTVRVPLGTLPAGMSLADPEARAKLISGLPKEPQGVTTTLKVEVDLQSNFGDTPIEFEKQLPGVNLAAFLTTDGWEAKAQIAIGPRISPTIGVAAMEVGVQRNATVWEHKGGTLAEELKTVKDNKGAIEKAGIKEDPKRAMPR